MKIVLHLFFITLIAFSEVLLCSICFGIPQEGDWAVYSVQAHAVCFNDTTDEKVQKEIDYYKNINNTKWNLTIQRVDYPIFKILIIKPLKNGTVSEHCEGNVETGDPDLSMWMISANLSVGGPIYKSGSDQTVLIKSEKPTKFAGATRNVVFTNFNKTELGIISSFAFFWDRETGVLCGMSSIRQYFDENRNPVLDVKVDIVIAETTLWVKTNSENNEMWPITVTLIVLLSTLVAIAMLFRKRKRKRKVGLRR